MRMPPTNKLNEYLIYSYMDSSNNNSGGLELAKPVLEVDEIDEIDEAHKEILDK